MSCFLTDSIGISDLTSSHVYAQSQRSNRRVSTVLSPARTLLSTARVSTLLATPAIHAAPLTANREIPTVLPANAFRSSIDFTDVWLLWTNSHRDSAGVQRMFACRVAAGDWCFGNNGQLTPMPNRATTCSTARLITSMTRRSSLSTTTHRPTQSVSAPLLSSVVSVEESEACYWYLCL